MVDCEAEAKKVYRDTTPICWRLRAEALGCSQLAQRCYRDLNVQPSNRRRDALALDHHATPQRCPLHTVVALNQLLPAVSILTQVSWQCWQAECACHTCYFHSLCGPYSLGNGNVSTQYVCISAHFVHLHYWLTVWIFCPVCIKVSRQGPWVVADLVRKLMAIAGVVLL